MVENGGQFYISPTWVLYEKGSEDQARIVAASVFKEELGIAMCKHSPIGKSAF